MWFKSALLICMIACILAEKDVAKKSETETELLGRKSLADARSKVIPVEEFVTSHKVPETIARPSDDDDDDDVIDVERRTIFKDAKYAKKVLPKFDSFEKKGSSLEPIRRIDPVDEDDDDKGTAKRQVHVELESFSDAGVLQEDGVRRTDSQKSRGEKQKESVIPGVYVSAEYPTTMMPVLTTPREARGFDFVPVNIIREDGKDAYTSFSDRNFGDLSDVSLVPAGTNSRIQVKKGPNGKDYEYEYVYYYYDEEDDSKPGTAGSAVTNSYDLPSRTTAQRRGGPTNSRGKYSSGERSSTVEPASNEVIPNRNGNRGRQLAEAEDVSEERLPTNTRFPPRSRSNHNTGTTESSRTRGNRPRPGLDLVDSSSFRTHQDGPEFPQVLPKGPVRFLGVTPNEDNERSEEKPASRVRGRPQRIQEPAPVEEITDDVPAPTTRRRPTSTVPTEIDGELNRGQPTRSGEEVDDEDETSALPERPKETVTSLESRQDSEELDSSSPSSSSTVAITTENPTTEYPSAMDKVALDLYAFLQQGQNNLVDASSSEPTDPVDATTMSDDEATTDLITTTELSATTVTTEPTTTTAAPTTTTTEPTTTTTTTTEPPTTTTQAPAGRGKFRRPGLGGPAANRNRFKSNGGGSTTTESSAEPTQRTRARFGSNGSNGGGFKRPRPGHKPVEEDAVQKESASSVNAEKPSTPRGRFRSSGGTRSTASTTTPVPSPANGSGSSASSPSGISRPSFNKLNINRRRGRPTTATPSTSEESQEAVQSEAGQSGQSGQSAKETGQETVTAAPKSNVRARLPGTAIRPGGIRPGPRVNIRQKAGQASTTSTAAPEAAEPSSLEEPAGEGTEEETHEAPAETVPPTPRSTTVNPLNKLRNRNRLQVQPKTTTRSPVSVAPRRSPLLPRRKATEAPIAQTSQEETSEEEVSSETETTEPTSGETSTAASTKHEETRGLSGLLAPRRRITPRRPGQIISRE